jgi:hypothetical protein
MFPRTTPAASRDRDPEFSTMLDERVQNEPVQTERRSASKPPARAPRRHESHERPADGASRAGNSEPSQTKAGAKTENSAPESEAAANGISAENGTANTEASTAPPLEQAADAMVSPENAAHADLAAAVGEAIKPEGKAPAKVETGAAAETTEEPTPIKTEVETDAAAAETVGGLVATDDGSAVANAVLPMPVIAAFAADAEEASKAAHLAGNGKLIPMLKAPAGEGPAAKPADAESEKPAAEAGAEPKIAADDKTPAAATKTHETARFAAEKPGAEFAALARADSAVSAQSHNTPDPSTNLPQTALHAAALQVPAAAPLAHTQTTVAPMLPAAVPLAGVAVAIAAKAETGTHHFEIRLDPPELGRIEVRLEVDRNGTVSSHLIAERRDTLDALRRDASGLERAMQEAGLKMGGGGMQFSLRDQNTGAQTPTPAQTVHLRVEDEISAINEAAARGYGRLAALRGGIDIRV